jgi:mono/diheme cytochrome c family protein
MRLDGANASDVHLPECHRVANERIFKSTIAMSDFRSQRTFEAWQKTTTCKSAKTTLPFPLNIRMSMMVWNFLFLNTKVFVADTRESAEWNRGAYLVQGAAHCSTCHTRGAF